VRTTATISRLAAALLALAAPAAALLALAAPAAARCAAPQLSATEHSELRRNIELGTLLYRYDQSAWHVTDAALAAMPEAITRGSRGYVTTPAPGGLRTTFFGASGSTLFPIYSAIWTGAAIAGEERYAAGRHAALSADELRLIDARRIALEGAGQLTMCSKAQPNVIVVPDPADAALTHVYVLTPQSSSGSFPMGGHHRVDVRDGRIVGSRAFAKSCIALGNQKIPEGAKPAAMFITHLLDPIPTEIHVFTVFGSGLPLYVGVHDGRVYSVEVRDGRAQAELVELKR